MKDNSRTLEDQVISDISIIQQITGLQFKIPTFDGKSFTELRKLKSNLGDDACVWLRKCGACAASTESQRQPRAPKDYRKRQRK